MKRGTYFFHPALPEGLPVSGDGRTGLSSKTLPLDPPPNTYVSQVIAEARSLPRAANRTVTVYGRINTATLR